MGVICDVLIRERWWSHHIPSFLLPLLSLLYHGQWYDLLQDEVQLAGAYRTWVQRHTWSVLDMVHPKFQEISGHGVGLIMITIASVKLEAISIPSTAWEGAILCIGSLAWASSYPSHCRWCHWCRHLCWHPTSIDFWWSKYLCVLLLLLPLEGVLFAWAKVALAFFYLLFVLLLF